MQSLSSSSVGSIGFGASSDLDETTQAVKRRKLADPQEPVSPTAPGKQDRDTAIAQVGLCVTAP